MHPQHASNFHKTKKNIKSSFPVNKRSHSQDISCVLQSQKVQEENLINIKPTVSMWDRAHTSGSVGLLKTTQSDPNIAALLQTTVYLGLGLLSETTNSDQHCHLTFPDNTHSKTTLPGYMSPMASPMWRGIL